MIRSTTKKAFSLIETLIAATIIVILLYSLVAVGRNSLERSSLMHERAQAMLLAQQGLEIVRQIRDTSWIDDTQQGWSDFVYNILPTPNWSSNTADPLKITIPDNVAPNRPFLTTAGTNPEVINVDNLDYTRTVKYTPLNQTSMPDGANDTGNDGKIQPDENAVKVTVTVSWDSGTLQTTSISEVLTNWRPNY